MEVRVQGSSMYAELLADTADTEVAIDTGRGKGTVTIFNTDGRRSLSIVIPADNRAGVEHPRKTKTRHPPLRREDYH